MLAIIPIGLILGGALATYLGIEEWKDASSRSELETSDPILDKTQSEMEKYKAEAEKLKTELEALRSSATVKLDPEQEEEAEETKE